MAHKFKVGDRVTLSGRVVDVDLNNSTLPYCVEFESVDDDRWINPRSLKPDTDYTTFRDQAAIAALQGILAFEGQSPLFGREMSERLAVQSAFDMAEALDAERKKRDGGAP